MLTKADLPFCFMIFETINLYSNFLFVYYFCIGVILIAN